MGAFVTAYVVVWLGVMVYIARLSVEQRRLNREVESLRSRLDDPRGP